MENDRKEGVSGKQKHTVLGCITDGSGKNRLAVKRNDGRRKTGIPRQLFPGSAALGIPGVSVGGEAAHGVEGRNDQNGLGKPDVTTSFPQPIGMSASWDPELIRQAGEITGTEARVVWHRHEAMDSADGLRPLILSAIRDGEETKKVTERILC